jgi:hypothetical protein
MNPYEKLLNRKRKWTPVQMTAGTVTDGSRETLHRVIALRKLELPVGDFILDALTSDVPEMARELLLSNVKDEENHDLALSYIADAFGVDEKAEKEALALREAWTSHPDHTILKAMVVERAVFFVLLPFLRAHGDAGMRSISADVSRDEQVHVSCNSLVCRELNLTYSPSLDKLRKATINWVMQPLGINTEDNKLDKNFWLRASDQLMYQGKAPELSFTKSARMPAFFEHDARNLPQYA